MNDKKTLNWSQLRYFFSFFKPQWKLILFSATGIYIGVILQLPLPLVTRHIIDNVLTGKDHILLNWIILGLFALVVFQMVSGIFTAYLSNLFKERVLNSFQLKLFEHMLHLNLSFFKMHKTGYLLARIERDVSNLRGLVANNLILLLKDILTFITGLVIIFLFHWKLALTSIVVLPLFIFSLKYFSQRIRKCSAEAQERSAHVLAFLQESLAGIFVVKAFQLEGKEKNRLSEKQQERMKINIKYGLISAYSSHITGFLGAIGPLVVLWYGSHEVMNGHLTLGSLIAFNAFLGYLFGPARRFMHLNEQVQDALASLERVSEFLSISTETDETVKQNKIDCIDGKVEFKGINFAYDDSETILENINFVANPGETVALVGKSGAGKTTLVNLIFRFYKPGKGTIFIDNRDISGMDIKELRKYIGIVPQEVFLFSGTIKENIRCGNLDVSDEDVLNAARLAYVDEFIDKLPDGYDTKVGERGVKLSGGQRQRIALARVILRDAKILILDEPTSELDSLSEKYIQEAFAEISKNRTTFVIAHRLSTIRNADKILFLRDGHIEDEGTHQSLYEKCPDYRQLYQTQFWDNRLAS